MVSSKEEQMDNLEEEFQKLVQSMYQQIQDKQNAGELTFYQAQDLRDMVNKRIVVTEEDDNSWCASNGYNDSWSSSTC
jgi:hypothetical protein